MPIRFAILASGSKGNATVIQSHNTTILIDAGIGISELERRLTTLDLSLAHVNALVITHLHGDHLRGPVVRACAVAGIPLYHHRLVGRAIRRKFPAFSSIAEQGLAVTFEKEPFTINDVVLEPVSVPHDAHGVTVAFVVRWPADAERKRIVVATDFGEATPSIIRRFSDADALILEFNHDTEMLRNSRRSEFLKNRVNGTAGHLSNRQAARALSAIISAGNRAPAIVVPAHLSKECNTPYLVLQAAQEVLAKHKLKDTRLHIASQDEPSGWFDLAALQSQETLF